MLSNIRDGKLKVQINGKDYEIEWNEAHESYVRNSTE